LHNHVVLDHPAVHVDKEAHSLETWQATEGHPGHAPPIKTFSFTLHDDKIIGSKDCCFEAERRNKVAKAFVVADKPFTDIFLI
jgi:hypothetical protein